MRSVLLFSVLLAAGCDAKKSTEPEPGAPAPSPSALVDLVRDSGAALGDPVDPPAPAGDLKEELERFVNVDQCVAERAKLDPLVGDALGAIGYETFLRDACRLLSAAKDRKRDACDKIDSSALRARCQTWVAVVSQAPDDCPMQFEGMVTRGRRPSCVALAARDPRLCAGEWRTAQRGTCEAMVARDAGKCDTLGPSQRALCQREVARWKSVLSPPLDGLEKLAPVRGRLSIHGAATTPDPPKTEVDLAQDFARGVVVVTARSPFRLGEGLPRMRVELGTVVESESARIAAAPQKNARVGVAVIFEPTTKKDAPRPVLEKLELELPGEAPIVSPPATCDCKLTGRVGAARGAEMAVVLDGTVTSGGRSYKMTIDLATFVRDVVPDLVTNRVVPPTHPLVPSGAGLFGRDGG